MKRKHLQHAATSMLILLGGFGGSPALADEYEIIDLGTLGGTSSSAWAVNSLGHVVGTSTTADGALHAFVWQGKIADIGPLNGDQQAQAFDINDAGDVAVMSFDLGETVTHGILWESIATTDLGAFAARGLSPVGTVVGHINVAVPDVGMFERAAKWEAGASTALGTLGGDFSYAYAVNEAGDAAGMSLLAGNRFWHAALYRSGLVVDLGTLGGNNSQAYDINSLGRVVGVADTSSGQPHAFLFTVNEAGLVTSRLDLGTLDGESSYANAINEAGVIVGTSGFRAFKWEMGIMTDLNSLLPPNSGWVLEVARGVNDAGAIVGQGLHYGQPRAFLLAGAEICASIDADHDGDIDLMDYSSFLAGFNGPAEP